MSTAQLSFTHRFEAGENPHRAPVLLLHGTGGDENDLIPLGEMIAPGASLLSPRGKVLEGSVRRFFRRFAEGVLDEDDLRVRTHELADFIAEARDVYGLAPPVLAGFSNGANIAAALLMLRPETVSGAVLFRAMAPFAEPPEVAFNGIPVLLLSGADDAMIPSASTSQLARTLETGGARLTHHTLPTGHGLTRDDVTLARDWLDALDSSGSAPPVQSGDAS